MPKVWLVINVRGSRGFSTVELLLAVLLFGFVTTALIGALVYGRSATAGAGDRGRAIMLADEGAEAVRNIRDAAYTNLADGTYGLATTGGQWGFSGSSDTNGVYTRSVTVASGGSNRKTITSNVSWPSGASTAQASVVTQLTNWMRAKSWTQPSLLGSYDAASTNDGLKVATAGNYAYVVRNDGTPDFLVVNISNPAAPTLAGSLSLAGVPTNVAVSGNYAYVTNTGDATELQIINVTNPASPTLQTSYNAAGNANGQGVTVSGNYAFVVRAANGSGSEFVALNITNPASPTLAGSYANNLSMREVYINGTTAFVVTDTGRLLVLNISNLSLIAIIVNFALAGSGTAVTIDGVGSTLYIGRGTSLLIYNVAVPLTPVLQSNTTIAGTVNDIDVDTTPTYAYLGTNATAGELQIMNITSPTAPMLAGSVDIPGTTSTLNGVAYSATLGVVAGASAADTQEAVVFGPN